MARLHPDTSPLSIDDFFRVLLVAGMLALGGCDGDDGDQGPAGPAGPGDEGSLSKVLEPRDDAPGVNLEVVSLTGGTGAGGNFQVGDRITVRYTLTNDDGEPWDLEELSRGRVLVSGPTFNYQRVIPEKSDLLTASTQNSDGSFSYRFADPIPATYLAPYNDTPSFGLDDGELQGQPLLAGTYSVGIYSTWDYSVGADSHRDQGEDVAHFLFGQATTIEPRAVVGTENCNACHSTLQAHGAQRRSVDLCVLCHTAGAEDRNVPSAAGGTPGETIAMDVMIHKIHSGAHLPSVLGVTTNPDGTRSYAATPEPYQLVGFGNSVHDYSEITFPYWPNLTMPLPRDAGYTALSSTDRAKEDQIRNGAASCFACHGDPDGAGPIEAPAQGDIAYSQPSRSSCGSCHDDWVWDFPYMANAMQMPEQSDDSACTLCHEVSGSGLDVMDAHRHPTLDPVLNPGLVFELLALAEAGVNDADDTIDPGEKIQVSFTIEDASGAAVDPALLAGITTTITGPTSNYNMLQVLNLPTAFLSGPQPFVVNVPESIWSEFVGNGTGGADEYTTDRAPHYTTGFATTVFAAAVQPTATTLAASTGVRQNYLDVVDSTGFARNDNVVLDRGTPGLEEYLVIQAVEEDVDGTTDRLWFGSPAQTDYPLGPRFAHTASADVELVAVTQLAAGVDYTLDAVTGTVTELGGGFPTGAGIFVRYTTDFVMPDVYELAFNDSPDLQTAAGEWSGLPILDGTYTFSIWGSRTLNVTEFGETTGYRNAAPAATQDFLVGDAAVIEPYASISSPDNCYSCHQDMYFHGSQRRGVDTCVACHGAAGGEDRPQYRAPNAPATTGTAIDFISMVHKIHQGGDLANASSYEIVGFGNGFPNNFSVHSYEHVFFPTLPGGTKHCAACHGDTNDAWEVPSEPLHPMAAMPTQSWSMACGSCHDSNAAQAHIEIMTSPVSGLESCATCHGPGDDLEVPLVHKTR